jgi:hypothetical protein
MRLQIRPDGADDIYIRLKERAQRIRELVGAARSCIIEIGRELIQAKAEQGSHGKWDPWLRTEFNRSPETAQRYMRVFETFGKSVPRTDLQDVTISIDAHALYALASPEVPQRARETAIKAAEDGERVSLADAQKDVHANTGDINHHSPDARQSHVGGFGPWRHPDVMAEARVAYAPSWRRSS